MKILALDPGGTTGWAYWDGEKFAGHGQLGPDEHHDRLYRLIHKCASPIPPGNLTVVCESFEFRQGKQRAGINLMSKEYIGVVKLAALMLPVKHVPQTASIGKGFVDDDKLKIMGIWDKTKGQRHARDAYRHLVYYLVNREKRYNLIESWKALA